MSLKMYILIRDDLSEAQQAVQAGHALAQFGLEHHKEFKAWQEDNNILIYLAVENINWWQQVLTDGGFKHSVFCETSMHSLGCSSHVYSAFGADTAIAVAPNWTCQYLLFKDLPLALQPSKSKRWWQR